MSAVRGKVRVCVGGGIGESTTATKPPSILARLLLSFANNSLVT